MNANTDLLQKRYWSEKDKISEWQDVEAKRLQEGN